MTQTKYVVQNPRGIPKGIRILRVGEREWKEGETFVKPKECPTDTLKRWVEDSFLIAEADLPPTPEPVDAAPEPDVAGPDAEVETDA